TSSTERRVAVLEVGWVVKPHGVRGEVAVAAITNVPERRFVAGAVLESDRGPLEVISARPHQDRWLVTFAGVSDRNAAEELRGVTLSAEPLDDDDVMWVHDRSEEHTSELQSQSNLVC